MTANGTANGRGRPSTWRSWSGLTSSRPARVLSPTSAEEVADAVVAARRDDLRVRMVGSGHSFTDVAVTDGVMLRPERLVGLCGVDPRAMTVTVLAGTPLHVLNRELHDRGLALANLGDIDRQTVAGAISTGTHGSGGRCASLSGQVVGVELVTGDGSVVRADRDHDPALFEAARLGLGAVGVLATVTFRVEPAFLLAADEGAMRFNRFVREFDELVERHDHVDAHWFHHTEQVLVKRNDRREGPARPLSPVRAYVDDELLANHAYGVMTRLGSVAPALVPTLNRVAAHTLSPRRYVDHAHRVLVSSRRVRFREMEYAVPREAGMEALVEARRVMDRGGWPVSIPVEVRFARAEDVWLSTAHGRDTVYLAFHVHVRTDHTDFFRAVETVMRDHDGRPHWGKLHSRTVSDLRGGYPRWEEFLAVRDRVDPGRVFTNPHLDRVLGA